MCSGRLFLFSSGRPGRAGEQPVRNLFELRRSHQWAQSSWSARRRLVLRSMLCCRRCRRHHHQGRSIWQDHRWMASACWWPASFNGSPSLATLSLSATYFDISRLAATSISQTAINISYTFIKYTYVLQWQCTGNSWMCTIDLVVPTFEYGRLLHQRPNRTAVA